MTKLNIALIQADLHWEDVTANLKMFEEQIASIRTKVDLIVLPETFSTGFSMQVEALRKENSIVLDWIKSTAAKHHCAISGSTIIFENDAFYNRLYFVDENKEILGQYDKRHLFTMGRENEHFQPGSQRVVVTYKGFRIMLQICYDLRFPVFSRNKNDYDVLLYVANWPAPRTMVWNTLLPARAIENQSFLIAVNRCGIDGEGIGTCGLSAVYDAKGQKIAGLKEQPGIICQTLDLNELINFREKFPVLKDADSFSIEEV